MRLKIISKSQDEYIFLVFQLCVSALIIFFSVIDAPVLASKMYSLSFINLIILYLVSYKRGNVTTTGWLLIVWSLLSISFSVLSSNRNFSLQDYVSFATFAAAILYFQVSINVNVTKKIAHSVLIMGFIISAIYPIGYYFLGGNYSRNMGSELLTMHFSSPNLTGMHLALGCFSSVLFLLLSRGWYKRILCLIVFFVDLHLLFLTGSRNSILSVLLFLIGIVVVKIRRAKTLNCYLSYFIIVSPFVFALMYLAFIGVIGNRGTLDFLVEEGKPITSRVTIWNHVFETLKGVHWLIGDYSKLRGNLHNTHMTVLGSYGVIGLVLLVGYLISLVNRVNRAIHSTSQVICLICFLGVILIGNGEAGLFYGGMGMYTIAGSYLLLARYDWEKELSERVS